MGEAEEGLKGGGGGLAGVWTGTGARGQGH